MSVEIDGKVYLGGGIRGNGINWGYLAVDAVGGGLAAAKFLRGETLGPNDVVEVRAQFEVGDVGRVPLIGEAMKKFMPGAAEADAGAVLKMKITGDGNGGIKVASVDGFVYADIPGPAGIVGTKPGQGFLNATAGFNWTPEKGIQSANNDLLKGQIAQVFKPPEGAVKGATGWTVVGTTSNDPSAALTVTSVETLPKLAPAIALAQATKFISDLTRSLDSVPGAPIVDPITHKSGPYTNTLVGVTQQIIGVPVPAVGGAFVGGFVRAQGTVTAIDDNSDAIRVKAGGNLLFQTSVTQLQGVTQNIQQSLHNLPGIGGLVPEPQQALNPKPEPTNQFSNMYRGGKDSIGLPGGQLQFDYFEYTGAAKGKAYAHGPNGTKYETVEVPATRDAVRGAFIKMYENNGINDLYGKPSQTVTAPKPEPVNQYSNMYRGGKDSIGLPGGQLQFDYFEYTGAAKGKAYAHGPNGTKYETVEVPATRDAVRGAFIKMYENNGINDLYPDKQSSAPSPTVANTLLEPTERNRGSTVALAANSEAILVSTADGRTLQLAKDGNTLVAKSGDVELMRFREGTTPAQAKELLESPASPLKGQGSTLPATSTQVAMQTPDRSVEQPKIGLG